jgi:hypothetical protein
MFERVEELIGFAPSCVIGDAFGLPMSGIFSAFGFETNLESKRRIFSARLRW